MIRSMTAIGAMAMFCPAAKPPVKQMGRYNKYNSGNQQPVLIADNKLFKNKTQHTPRKNSYW